MRAASLLRLYPPAWRARYGEEFLALAGDRRLSLLQTLDAVAGALDAWLTADVRRAAAAATEPKGGTHVLKSLSCSTQPRVSTRDGLIGAAAMIGATLVFTAMGVAVDARGWDDVAQVIMGLSFPASLTVSMPFWLMPGVPRRAQWCIVGVVLAVLATIGVVTATIVR
jgi:hypothetical protein